MRKNKELSSTGTEKTNWKTGRGETSIKKKKEYLQRVNKTWLEHHVECLIIKLLPVHRTCTWRQQKSSSWLKDSG